MGAWLFPPIPITPWTEYVQFARERESEKVRGLVNSATFAETGLKLIPVWSAAPAPQPAPRTLQTSILCTFPRWKTFSRSEVLEAGLKQIHKGSAADPSDLRLDQKYTSCFKLRSPSAAAHAERFRNWSLVTHSATNCNCLRSVVGCWKASVLFLLEFAVGGGNMYQLVPIGGAAQISSIFWRPRLNRFIWARPVQLLYPQNNNWHLGFLLNWHVSTFSCILRSLCQKIKKFEFCFVKLVALEGWYGDPRKWFSNLKTHKRSTASRL